MVALAFAEGREPTGHAYGEGLLGGRGRVAFRCGWDVAEQVAEKAAGRWTYVTPWDDTPQWGREAAGSVYAQVRHFIEVSGRTTARLSREQKSRFVATCWTVQMFKHFEDPKPGYAADWPDLRAP
ncbi:hypothetical protein [Streptomyces sp. Amel2xC10]|uniref:hypothetical protein n=1 Tax=Streptomyces sp. Amel2xC10 TaxID=1305826 RepID=UPI000A08AE19|nr:hypothetical protein [Streptomyces sp. Amel2xC10]SMF67726.1 hypothetical protein SAMN02745830_05190 [Streptomyces sp. Amel2xC10]